MNYNKLLLVPNEIKVYETNLLRNNETEYNQVYYPRFDQLLLSKVFQPINLEISRSFKSSSTLDKRYNQIHISRVSIIFNIVL